MGIKGLLANLSAAAKTIEDGGGNQSFTRKGNISEFKGRRAGVDVSNMIFKFLCGSSTVADDFHQVPPIPLDSLMAPWFNRFYAPFDTNQIQTVMVLVANATL
jgi:hypothetical protein